MSNMHQQNHNNIPNFNYFHGYQHNNLQVGHGHTFGYGHQPLSSQPQYRSMNNHPSYQQSDF